MKESSGKWTFVELGQATEGSASDTATATAPASNQLPLWVKVTFGLSAVGGVIGGVATGIAVSSAASSTSDVASPPSPDVTRITTPQTPPPPIPPVQPPYNADEAEDYCSNDCLGCATNGGCTYSYGADGDPNTQHDPRYYQSNGVCDDGGPGAEQSMCDYGSDCADCGIRPMPPPPPLYPSMPPGL